MKALIVGLALLAVVGLSSCLFEVKYSVGGTVTGLRGTGLVLKDNSHNALSVASNGSFTFTKGVAKGRTYAVTVTTQPSNPTQTCTVQTGSGTMRKGAVTNVIVHCTQAGRYAYVANQTSNTISAFLIAGGTLSPLSDSPIVLAGNAAPMAVAIDPNGAFLFVANSGTNNVAVYAIDDPSGLLRSVGVAPTDISPAAITIDPTDRFLYAANSGSTTVSAFTITSSGVLTPVAGSPFTVGRQPTALQTDPSGSFLYVTNFLDNNVTALDINSGTGALSAISGSPYSAGAGPVSIAVAPLGTFAFVANATAATISSYSITASTGVLALINSSSSTGSAPESLAINPPPAGNNPGGTPAGTYLYAANVKSNNDVTPYTIGSGALSEGTPVADGGTLPLSIAMDPTGGYLYAANFNSGNVSVFSVGTGGALTALPPTFAAGGGARSIAID